MISGYTKEDITALLQRVYKETEENRDKALKLYEHMENAMLQNKGDLVILSQMADRYLEQATRQTDALVNLARVMQKLREVDNKPDSPSKNREIENDINMVLEKFDIAKMSPFSVPAKKVPIEKKSEQPKDDVELETDL